MPFTIGLQLYTVRDVLSADFLGGLEQVADIGYRFVEFAGFGDSTPERVGSKLEELGLAAVGSHVPLSILEDAAPIVDDLRAIDCTTATLPWVPESMREDWSNTAARLDETSIRLAEAGIEFSYHNHAFEFDRGGFDALTSATKKTAFQLDVYWVEKAGESAVDWIRRLQGRLSSLHCKDLAEDGNDIELGEGVLDWRSILEEADAAGVNKLIVEMDTPRHSPMKSAAACLQGLSSFI